MTKSTRKIPFLLISGLFSARFLLGTEPVLAQSTADSVQVFRKEPPGSPAFKPVPITFWKAEIKPVSMLNPELDLYGPSDLLPYRQPDFQPESKLVLYLGSHLSDNGELGAVYTAPGSRQFRTLEVFGNRQTEKTFRLQTFRGDFITGNSQLNTGMTPSGTSYSLAAGLDYADIQPHQSTIDTSLYRTLRLEGKVKSDPLEDGTSWRIDGFYHDYFSSGPSENSGGSAGLLAESRFDLSFLYWISRVEGWQGTGRSGSDSRAGKAETGFQAGNEVFSLEVAGGYFHRNDAGAIRHLPSGSAKLFGHTRHFHHKLEWTLYQSLPAPEFYTGGFFWVNPGKTFSLNLHQTNRAEYILEWIPSDHWIVKLGTLYHESEDRLYPDTTGTTQWVTVSSHQASLSCSWYLNPELVLRLYGSQEIFFGKIKSVPFLPAVTSGLDLDWLTENQKNRISARARYHTNRYTDPQKQKKLPDYSDILLRIDDFHFTTLNFYGEIRIIVNNKDLVYPGFNREANQITFGVSFKF
ncbi:MAG: hypothetical protein L6Q77_06625 [Bacteroidetes bacterium]|nr:hypothetical protein [Bacteroidota bacterium]